MEIDKNAIESEISPLEKSEIADDKPDFIFRNKRIRLLAYPSCNYGVITIK